MVLTFLSFHFIFQLVLLEDEMYLCFFCFLFSFLSSENALLIKSIFGKILLCNSLYNLVHTFVTDSLKVPNYPDKFIIGVIIKKIKY